MGEGEKHELRLQIADLLELIADQPGWSDKLWSRFNTLLKSADVDGVLGHADEELIHYSGEFNSRNLLLMRVKPDADQVGEHKEELRRIAAALRSGITWDEYKRTNSIYELGLARLFGAFRRH